MTKANNKQISARPLTSVLQKSCVAILCAYMTAGCASNMGNFTGVEPQNRNEVEMVRIPFELHFEAGSEELSGREIARLNHFLSTSNVGYGDEFSMDFPLERNGNLSEMDAKRHQYISSLLKDNGIYLSADITPYGMEPSANTGRLLVSKYVVTPPECGDWSQKSYPNYENAPLSALGCASQANLGLMVANPRDLIIGAEGGPASAERAAGAVDRYQTRTTVVAPSTTGSTGN